MGLPLLKFSHNSFLSGENKGEPPSTVRSTELDRSMNVEMRGIGLATRYGAKVLTGAGDPFVPAPIATNPTIRSCYGFAFGTSSYDTLFTAGTVLYHTPATPVAIYTGLGSDLDFQYTSSEDIAYMTNGVDPVLYYDPTRSTATAYVAGYPTMVYPVAPAAMTLTPSNGAGSLTPAVTYEYHVVFYDENTETTANPPAVAASVLMGVADDTVTFTDLPIDAAGRTSHWLFYRKDPGLFYFYFLKKVAYNAAAPTWTDLAANVGRTRNLEYDNYAPDVSKGCCLITSQRVMLYFINNDITWSKRYRYQNVPTPNRDRIDDSSQVIVAVVDFKGAIIVFKTESIYVINGDLLGNYSIKKFSKSIGTRAPHSIAADSDGVYFLDSRGRPRYINATDFSSEDLRDTTDISHKYRAKFDLLSRTDYGYCHAVLWRTGAVEQYRLFVPIDTADGTCDHCYIYDIGVAHKNGGDSSWFDYSYNMKAVCSTVIGSTSHGDQIHVGDNYGLMWWVDIKNHFYDGNEYYDREEGVGTLTLGVNTIDVAPSPVWTVNQFIGHEVILYSPHTVVELFRSKIASNTASRLTLVTNLSALPTSDLYITIGGYPVHFATSWFTRDHAGKNVPDKMSLSFDRQYETNTELYAFVNYDYNTIFNLIYDYMGDETLSSLTPQSDIYSLVLGESENLYGQAIYDVSLYGRYTYELTNFLLRSFYYFSHVSWGLITRAPNKPFGYIGGSLYFRSKGNLL